MVLALQVADILPRQAPTLRLVSAPPLDLTLERLEELIEDLSAKEAQAKDGTERAIMRARELGAPEPLGAKYASLIDHLANSTCRLLATLSLETFASSSPPSWWRLTRRWTARSSTILRP
jgi:hypothetical protein